MTRERGDLIYRVARRIADRRRARSLSQESFAALLGIAAKNVQRIESGKQNLSLATLERICEALETTPEALVSSAPPPGDIPALPPTLARLACAGFRVGRPTEHGRRPRNAVPVMTLQAAAGKLAGASKVSEVLGWVVLPQDSAPPKGQFVAAVVGRSMEPRIGDRSLVLFGPPSPPPYRDRIFLVRHGSLVDAETGALFAIKRLKSMRRLSHGRTRVVLESLNAEFPPVVVDTQDDDDVRVIAELLRVLVPG